MAETLRDLGVVVDHPSRTRYEIASGDVEWLFVPLEAAAKMRASFILLGPAADPVRAGHHQQPGRRPDRPAAGRPPRRGDARAGRLDRLPQRLLLRDLARDGCAAPRSRSRSCRSWAPRTRCSPRRSPRATPSSARPPRSRRSTTSSRSCARWARRSSGPRPTPSRSRVASACAAPSIAVVPDRIEAGTFIVAAAVTGGQRDARRSALRPPRRRSSTSSARVGVGIACGDGHDRGRRDRAARRRLPGDATSRRPRIRAWPPTSSRRRACC